MDAAFWHKKWETDVIGFHRSRPNPLLVKHIEALALAPGDRVFLPLCGKTLDIGWLLSRGYQVAGAELSTLAISQLFDELGVEPQIEEAGVITHYQAGNLDIFAGDFFELSTSLLGPIDAVFDRAALVALPTAMRPRYTNHLRAITAHAKQLLITFEYDQNLMDGPPFSVVADEVHQHYSQYFELTLLETTQVEGGLKGFCPASEDVWLVNNNAGDTSLRA